MSTMAMWKLFGKIFGPIFVGFTILFVYSVSSNQIDIFDKILTLSTPILIILAIVIPIIIKIKNRSKIYLKNDNDFDESRTKHRRKSSGKSSSWKSNFVRDPKKYGSHRNPATENQLNALRNLGYKGKEPSSSAEADRLIKRGPRRR